MGCDFSTFIQFGDSIYNSKLELAKCVVLFIDLIIDVYDFASGTNCAISLRCDPLTMCSRTLRHWNVNDLFNDATCIDGQLNEL